MHDILAEIYRAYLEARRNKRNTRTQLDFELNLEANLYNLAKEVDNGTYKVGRSSCFIIDNPVQREIFAADFRDRVIHHFLYRRINNIIDDKLIYDCYSCRKEKGTLFGVKRLHHHIKSCTNNYKDEAWILKLDIQGYFMNISRTKLYKELMSMVPDIDPLTKDLCRKIVFADPIINCKVKSKEIDWKGLPKSKSLFHTPAGCGLPIGNLTSQLFSNVYLNKFDHYVKRTLKAKHYGRYVDDFYIVDPSKERLLEMIGQINDYLAHNLELELHPKKIYLQSTLKGVEFLGIKTKLGAQIPGRRFNANSMAKVYEFNNRVKSVKSKKELKTLLNEVMTTTNSYLGLLKHYNGYRVKLRIMRKMSPEILKHFTYDHKLNKITHVKI